MLEWVAAAVAAGGTAVVQAAGTDAWAIVRQRTARLLSRDDPERERTELMRLDQTATDLASLPRATPRSYGPGRRRPGRPGSRCCWRVSARPSVNGWPAN